MQKKLRRVAGGCSSIGNNHLDVTSNFRAGIVQIWPQFVNCEQNVKISPLVPHSMFGNLKIVQLGDIPIFWGDSGLSRLDLDEV